MSSILHHIAVAADSGTLQLFAGRPQNEDDRRNIDGKRDFSARPDRAGNRQASCRKKDVPWLMPTGSVMSTRVCNTATKWREFDDYNSEGANQFRNTYRMTTTGNQNPAAPGVPGS